MTPQPSTVPEPFRPRQGGSPNRAAAVRALPCPHCRAFNDPDERRCIKCGRKFATQGSHSEVLTTEEGQAEMFPGYDPNAVPANVIPIGASRIPTLSPVERERTDPVLPRKPKTTPRPSAQPSNDLQGRLEFQGLLTTFPAVSKDTIFTDAAVATPKHRALASVVDALLVLVGVGLFLAVFLISGGEGALGQHAVAMIFSVCMAVAVFYRLLWCCANTETPGMRAVGLRVIDFDGRAPSQPQRLHRECGRLLAVASAGLGLLWAAVDEEGLAWHDHMSKTFPTSD